MRVSLNLFVVYVVLPLEQISSCPDDQCRILAFPSSLFFVGERLVNHTMANISVIDRDACEYRCYLNHDCVSINFYFGQNEAGTDNCEMNNATAKEYDDDLVKAANYVYHGTKNYCAGSPCKNKATCQSGFTRKRYRCLCTFGFTGQDCEKDIDVCSKNAHNCTDRNVICQNTEGSFKCICKPGFSRKKQECTDIDECALKTHSCSKDNAICSNTVGSFNCSCNPGFTGDGHKCTDIDECALRTHNCNKDNATCANTVGSFKCSCNSGFTGDGHKCKDTDECNASVHACDENADCENIMGSYRCFCKTGFSGDGHTCTDIDECASGEHDCNVSATCVNTEGSFICSCNQLYVGDGRSCVTLPSECQNYGSLMGKGRKITYGNQNTFCDNRLHGWYRFEGAAGTTMPTSCPPKRRCNTRAPGWLNGTHPTEIDGQVTRTVCFHWKSNCCYFSSSIKVRNCGGYYVYYINGTPKCFLRYCGTD